MEPTLGLPMLLVAWAGKTWGLTWAEGTHFVSTRSRLANASSAWVSVVWSEVKSDDSRGCPCWRDQHSNPPYRFDFAACWGACEARGCGCAAPTFRAVPQAHTICGGLVLRVRRKGDLRARAPSQRLPRVQEEDNRHVHARLGAHRMPPVLRCARDL